MDAVNLWDFKVIEYKASHCGISKVKTLDSIGELGYVKLLGVAITTFVGATLFYIILARDFKSFGRPTPLRLCLRLIGSNVKGWKPEFF